MTCVTSKFGGLDGTYSHKTSPSQMEIRNVKTKKKKKKKKQQS